MIDWYVQREYGGAWLVAYDDLTGKCLGSVEIEAQPDSPERQAEAILDAANEILEAKR